jgi:hypothetical protein
LNSGAKCILPPKINPNEYQIPDKAEITLENIQKATEKAYSVFPAQITKSEVWKNGIVAVLAQGKIGKNQIKMEFYAKKKDGQIVLKLNHNLRIEKHLNVPEPREVPPDQSDIALFLKFWDGLLQGLGLSGREDIGKPQQGVVSQTENDENEDARKTIKISASPNIQQEIEPELTQTIKPQTPIIETDEEGWNTSTSSLKLSNQLSPLPKNVVKPSIIKDEVFETTSKSTKNQENFEESNEVLKIEEKYDPFLIDQLGANEYYWKLPKSERVTAASIIKTFQVNLAIDGFKEEDPPNLPRSLALYQATGKFGPDKLTLLIVAGERKDNVYVRFISKSLKLKDITNPAMKKTRPDKNQSAYFIKLCDNVCKDLKIPERKDLGGMGTPGKIIETIDFKIEKIKPEILGRFKEIVKQDQWMTGHLERIENDLDSINENFGYIRQLLEKNTRWTMKNLDTVLFAVNKYFSPYVFAYVDILDIKSTQLYPIYITYTIISPKPIARDMVCSYKGVWSTNDNDDVSQKMCTRLNNEYPSLDNQLQELMKNEYTYLYVDNEIAVENKKTLKLKVEQTIHEPIKIRTIQLPNNKTVSILFYSYFLSPESQGYQGFRKLGEILEIFDNAMNGLSKFFVISDEERQLSESQQKAEKEKSDAQKLNKCPKCGWVLSPGKFTCPMCKFDSSLIGGTQAIKSDDDFTASAALLGTASTAKATALIGSIDSTLNQLDDELVKAREKFISAFRTMVKNDGDSKAFISNIQLDNATIQQQNGPLLLSLKQDLDFDIIPFKLIQIDTNELNLTHAVIVLSMIKPEITDYHIPLVSYLVEVPAVPDKIILSNNIKFVASGEDWGFCRKLNSTPDFMGFMKDIYGGDQNKYTIIFHAKKKDLIGRIVPVEGLDFELKWLIAIRPFVQGGSPDRQVLVLHHFILSEAEDYAKIVPLSKTLPAIDAIITGINMVQPKEEVEEEPVRHTEYVPVEPKKSIFAEINEEFDQTLAQSDEASEISEVFGNSDEEEIDIEAFKASMKADVEPAKIISPPEPSATPSVDEFNFDFNLPSVQPVIQPPKTDFSELTPEIQGFYDPIPPNPTPNPYQNQYQPVQQPPIQNQPYYQNQYQPVQQPPIQNQPYYQNQYQPVQQPSIPIQQPIPTPSAPIRTTLKAIPADLMTKCKALAISPILNSIQIQEKLKELEETVKNLLEMKNGLRISHENKEMTIEQYMEQDAILVDQLEKIEMGQEVLKELLKYR